MMTSNENKKLYSNSVLNDFEGFQDNDEFVTIRKPSITSSDQDPIVPAISQYTPKKANRKITKRKIRSPKKYIPKEVQTQPANACDPLAQLETITHLAEALQKQTHNFAGKQHEQKFKQSIRNSVQIGGMVSSTLHASSTAMEKAMQDSIADFTKSSVSAVESLLQLGASHRETDRLVVSLLGESRQIMLKQNDLFEFSRHSNRASIIVYNQMRKISDHI